MITLNEIVKILKPHKKDVFKNYNLKELGIFGSIVREENNSKSDIDIIVEYKVIPDLLKYIELERHIENILNSNVDLVIKNSIRDELKESVLNDAVFL